MVSLGQVALDGTKVRANASRRKAMSYARMSEKQKILAAEVSDLLAQAERIDKDEDKKFSKDNKGYGLPDELARREGRLAKIPKNLTPRQRMARKLRIKTGKADYARRKAIVEPVFGQIATLQGKHVLLRGLDKRMGPARDLPQHPQTPPPPRSQRPGKPPNSLLRVTQGNGGPHHSP